MVIPELVEKLSAERDLNDANLKILLETDSMDEALFFAADQKRREIYGDGVYIRGLIEFTNHCRNNCYYCDIRRDNTHAERYRLSKEEILTCCAEGYALGFRTFVLQGGEDPWFNDDRVCEIVSEIRSRYPDCAVTLSIAKSPGKVFMRSSRPVQTGTSCGMKRPMSSITGNFIRTVCVCKTGNAAYMI